jgi:DNA-binding response OmpR family regulator
MTKKILVIEDDKFLLKIINKKLSTEDYQLIQAMNGEEGLRAAREKKPDLILLDLVLPEMDGFEVLKRLKDNPTCSNIPVIVLSNLGEREKIDKGLKLGAADYLVKADLNPGEIVNRIKLVLEKDKK